MMHSCLVGKDTVCAGFASSFAVLTRLMGMESAYISKDIHAWNVVKIDGQWFCFDATLSSKGRNKAYAILQLVEVEIKPTLMFDAVIWFDITQSAYGIQNPGHLTIKLIDY